MSQRPPTDNTGTWLWEHMLVVYLVAVAWLLALNLLTDQPARGLAQAGVTAVLTVLFTVGARADMRRRFGRRS